MRWAGGAGHLVVSWLQWSCVGVQGLGSAGWFFQPGSVPHPLDDPGAPPASPALGSQEGHCVSGTREDRAPGACQCPEHDLPGRQVGQGHHPTGGSSAGWLGTVATASVVTHVLHAHTAPDTQHEALDVTLVGSTQDSEVALLAPRWAPRVGCGLEEEVHEQGMEKRGQGEGAAAAGPAAQGLTQYLSVLPSGSDSSPHLRARPGRSKGADSTCFQELRPWVLPSQAPAALGHWGTPLGLGRSLSCLPLPQPPSKSVCLHPEDTRGITEGHAEKGDPHPVGHFSGTSHFRLLSLLTWGAKEEWVPGARRKRLRECGCPRGPKLQGKELSLAGPQAL